MRIVTISTVRNEADIIEAFIRYHVNIADRMIILNHRSSDATGDILKSLQDEGLPVDVVNETGMVYDHVKFMTDLMRQALRDYKPDWVVPVDADEFIVSDSGSLQGHFKKLDADKGILIPWRTYVPLPSDREQEPNVLKRIQYFRKKEEPQFYKVLIPRAIAERKEALVARGSHSVQRRQRGKLKDYPSLQNSDLFMAHFPVRSSDQIMIKTIVCWLATLAKPGRLPDEGFHHKELYDRLVRGGSLSRDELMQMGFEYASKLSSRLIDGQSFVLRPIESRRQIEIKYRKEHAGSPSTVLASMAEEFAEAYANSRRESEGPSLFGKMFKRVLKK